MTSRTSVLSDAQLTDSVADRLQHPKAGGATSFTLHAPLELLARTALLAYVEADARDAARDRLAWLGQAYAEAGDEVGEPGSRAYDDVANAVDHLTAAINAGDLDDADATAAWLAQWATPVELSRALADDVIPRLAAAGHGSILLYLLPRVAPRSRAATRPLRGLVRELARNPDWGLTWHQERTAPPPPDGGDLVAALRRPRSPGDPGSDFIYPTMSIVEQSGLAEELLDGPTRKVSLMQASQDLLRLAAASMVQDDPAAAPYGWSHCLTMPQAVLGLARSGATTGPAVAVAATFVLGFRATQGTVEVDPGWSPPATGDALEALDGSPQDAAAGAWHATNGERAAVVARLASRAAAHEDAHLAKYTLACFDAARDDPGATRLFLAAAASLGAWWRTDDR
ncbi:MAG TPA: hypothetical protein VID94_01085 [Acidimicrobiales bacterium]